MGLGFGFVLGGVSWFHCSYPFALIQADQVLLGRVFLHAVFLVSLPRYIKALHKLSIKLHKLSIKLLPIPTPVPQGSS